jgi:hypothetical protein
MFKCDPYRVSGLLDLMNKNKQKSRIPLRSRSKIIKQGANSVTRLPNAACASVRPYGFASLPFDKFAIIVRYPYIQFVCYISMLGYNSSTIRMVTSFFRSIS